VRVSRAGPRGPCAARNRTCNREVPTGFRSPSEIVPKSHRPKKQKAPGNPTLTCLSSLRNVWSGRRDSNPRPQPWQGCALPLSYTRIRDSRAALAARPGYCPKAAGSASALLQFSDRNVTAPQNRRENGLFKRMAQLRGQPHDPAVIWRTRNRTRGGDSRPRRLPASARVQRSDELRALVLGAASLACAGLRP
jgi:hypothetical protein